MSGVFHGEGACRLRDILGFFSFPCGLVQHRSLAVQSSPCLSKPFRIDAHSGAEDRRNKTANDEERYYMREYAPGDRFRDINWKSSGRIDTLITRISPDNQEKVSRIEVYFRNYLSTGKALRGKGLHAGLEDLWLLDRAKARLAQFLRAVKAEQAAYVFNIRAAQRSWDIKDQDELDRFLEELASLPFVSSRNDGMTGTLGEVPPLAPGELYVFSTAADGGLPAFLLARQALPVYVFFSRPPVPGSSPETVEKLRIRDFAANGFIPAPQWLFSPGGRSGGILNTRPEAGRTLVDYAEAVW
jgi:hypothetical protein